MATCVNDFTPLITALATLITVQFPVIITLLVNQYRIRHDVNFGNRLTKTINEKTDHQTVIMHNGFNPVYGPAAGPEYPAKGELVFTNREN